MIEIDFFENNKSIFGFSVSGHAQFSNFGEDVVCAGVSSAVMMTINTITEILNVAALVELKENLISINTQGAALDAFKFKQLQVIYDGFHLHMKALSEDYNDNITIKYVEV